MLNNRIVYLNEVFQQDIKCTVFMWKNLKEQITVINVESFDERYSKDSVHFLYTQPYTVFGI